MLILVQYMDRRANAFGSVPRYGRDSSPLSIVISLSWEFVSIEDKNILNPMVVVEWSVP